MQFLNRAVYRSIFKILLAACILFSIGASGQETKVSSSRQVLFVCTGNFYRSRFAESFFNQKAREAHSGWRAISRGLALVPSQHGISPYARRELLKRGVAEELCKGVPTALAKDDLEKSSCIVVMDEAEHRAMFEKKFPFRDERKIHYWHIGDGGRMSYAKACEAMSKEVEQLLRILRR